MYTNISTDLALDENTERVRRGRETNLKFYVLCSMKHTTSKFTVAQWEPQSQVIAQLVLEYLEQTVIKQLNIKLPFFYHHGDDCILIAPKTPGNIYPKWKYHPKLKFTLEIEQETLTLFLRVKNLLKTPD